MINIMFIAICAAAIRSGHTSSLTFVLFALGHNYAYQSTSAHDYWQYYLSAAAFAVVAMGVMSLWGEVGTLTTGLMAVCTSAFLLNVYGCFCWYTFMAIESYNLCATILYLATIIVMLWKDKALDGISRSYIVFRPFSRESFALYNSLSKETKT